jgi:cobalt-zinc-cadmium efflux system outer membrane protein
MRSIAAFLLSAAALCAQARPDAGGDRLTVEQAVTEALEHNLGLIAERYALPIAEARIITAHLRPNPVLTVEGDHLPLAGTIYNSENNGGPPEYSVRTDFVFERGHKRAARIAVAEGNRSVVEYQVLNTARGIILDVSNAWIDLASARDALQLAQENLKALHEIVNVDQARVKSGDLAEVELLRAQLAELQFENAVRQAEVRVATVRARLQVLLGRDRNARPAETAGELRRDVLAVTEAELKEQARQRRPDLQALVHDQARSQAELRNQLALGKVDYTIGSEFRRQQGLAGHGNSLGFFLQTNLPVFNRNQGEIERARREALQIQARIRASEAALENEVEIAWLQYSSARFALEKIEQTMVGKAREVRGITEYSYKRGEATFIEFLDAQRAYNDTIQAYNDLRAEFARSLYSMEAATGGSAALAKANRP